MGEAPPSRYDYGIILDYDPSGTISRNLLEYFQNILLLTDRIATDPRTFLPEPSRQHRIQFLKFGQECRQGAASSLPRCVCAFKGRLTLSTTGNFPTMHVCSEDTSGTTIVRTCSPQCEAHEYFCPTVDANVNRVLPLEVAQAVMVPTTLVSRSLLRDVGKELPRV